MTVNNSTASVIHRTDSSVSAYSFPFKVFKAAEVAVTVLESGSRAANKLAQTADFTVSGLGSDSGGLIALTAGGQARAGTGNSLLIARDMEFVQNTDFRPHDILPAETIERAFDLLTMEIQQVNELAQRAVTRPLDQPEAVAWDDVLLLTQNAAAAKNEAVAAAAEAARVAEKTANLLRLCESIQQELEAAGGQGADIIAHNKRPDAHAALIDEHSHNPGSHPGLISAHAADPLAHSALFDSKTRRRLTANTTIYVRPDGHDSNNGLGNSAAGALKTPAGLRNWLGATDQAGFTVKALFQGGGGSYGHLNLSALAYTGALEITALDPAIYPVFDIITVANGLFASVHDIETLRHVEALNHATIDGYNLIIGKGVSNYSDRLLYAMDMAMFRFLPGTLDLYGQPAAVFRISNGSIFDAPYRPANQGKSRIYFNNIMVSESIVSVAGGAAANFYKHNIEISGTAIGKRFDVWKNSILDTYGGGPDFFPGTVAGTADTATGGVYA